MKETHKLILKAAKQCLEVKSALEATFPDAFKKKRLNLRALKISDYLFSDGEARRAGFDNRSFMKIRRGLEYEGIAIFLDEDYLKWELKRDSNDLLCLTVERKRRN